MGRNRVTQLFVLLSLFAVLTCGKTVPVRNNQPPVPPRKPDVIFVGTPLMVVDAMLETAQVSSKDVVYDLGCGDGRIVISAAKNFGARGVCVDIDPKRIEEAKENARKEGVAHRVDFRVDDLFETDIRKATVVTLYLLTSLNLKLRPILWEKLKVGTRVVSHAFDMGDWAPDRVVIAGGRTVYFWTITQEVKDRLASEP